MKDRVLSILGVIILILFSPLIILTMLVLLVIDLLCYPFRNSKYKKSCFYRDFGLKFNQNYYCSGWYELYNAIRANDLPIRCIPRYDDQGKLFWMNFIYDGKLFSTHNPEFLYDRDNEIFYITDVNDSDEEFKIPLCQYSEESLSEWNAAMPDENRCYAIVFLMTDSDFADLNDLVIAKDTPDFLFYDPKKIAEALRRYIAEQ